MTSCIGRGARDPGPWNQPGVIAAALLAFGIGRLRRHRSQSATPTA